ncbi:MAG TPA: protein kinase [Planctomycetota bacterium]|nr:protein kinase [Planctomycetota bacterium]
MPDYSDLFLIQILLEKKLITVKELRDPLCFHYRKMMSGTSVPFSETLEQLGILNQEDLYKIDLNIKKIMSTISPISTILPENILIEDCKQEKLLGNNSLGSTYLANHPQLGHSIYKKLDGIIGRNAKFMKRFLSSMKKMEKIRHKNLADVYKVDIENHVVLREFIEGETLETLLQKRVLNCQEASVVLVDVINGLQTLYKHGILHRNLKPSNIIITNVSHAKILDASLPPTVATYLAPEQIQKKRTDVRSDIYALGMMYYRSLGGQSPDTLAEFFQEKEIPEMVCKILQKILDSNYENRYANYENILQDLKEYLNFAEIEIEDTIFSIKDHCQRAQQVATEIIQELIPSWTDAIQNACLQQKFYEHLAPMIQIATQKFVHNVGVEWLDYLDVALEDLRQSVTLELMQYQDELEDQYDTRTEESAEDLPKGFIPINEHEILDAEVASADLADIMEEDSIFQTFSDLENIAETSMDAVSVDDENDFQWDTDESFPQEKDFDMVFGKQHSSYTTWEHDIDESIDDQEYLDDISETKIKPAFPKQEETSPHETKIKPAFPKKEEMISSDSKIKPAFPKKEASTDEPIDSGTKIKPAFPKKEDSTDEPIDSETKIKPAFPKKEDSTDEPIDSETKLKPAFPKKEDPTDESIDSDSKIKPILSKKLTTHEEKKVESKKTSHPTYSFTTTGQAMLHKKNRFENKPLLTEQNTEEAQNEDIAIWKRPANEIHISNKPLPDQATLLELAKQDMQAQAKNEEKKENDLQEQQEQQEEQEAQENDSFLSAEEKEAKLKPYFLTSNTSEN